ncbi:hypothetical protein L211DRAFT_836191 [Terfezia boudieri ATCC MYA-4762]|uniref:Uncharacterized protein n=1 Tax=Terfezia boudieri ATCC MYA-4762 TaxID=1051890 RepID=A0A3N4LWB9_9PEZI|nr:hypothetical protein L211DRAFT_836191 [Terfezia boudieri ATCC MYA-4762]
MRLHHNTVTTLIRVASTSCEISAITLTICANVNFTTKELKKEIKKATRNNDLLVMGMPNHSCSIVLPPNVIVVDKDNWGEYYGPFSGRAYRIAQRNVV